MLTYKQNFPLFSTHVSCFALPIYFFEFEKSSYQSGQVAVFSLILDLTDDPFLGGLISFYQIGLIGKPLIFSVLLYLD